MCMVMCSSGLGLDCLQSLYQTLCRHLFWIITFGLHNFIPVLYCMKYQFSLLSVLVIAGMLVEGLVIMLCVWYLLISESISLSRHVSIE